MKMPGLHKILVKFMAFVLSPSALLSTGLSNHERHFDRLSSNATFYSRNNADPVWDGPNR